MRHLLTFLNFQRFNVVYGAASLVIFVAGIAQFQALFQSAINSVTEENWKENAKLSGYPSLLSTYKTLNSTGNFLSLSVAAVLSNQVLASRNLTTKFKDQPEIQARTLMMSSLSGGFGSFLFSCQTTSSYLWWLFTADLVYLVYFAVSTLNLPLQLLSFLSFDKNRNRLALVAAIFSTLFILIGADIAAQNAMIGASVSEFKNNFDLLKAQLAASPTDPALLQQVSIRDLAMSYMKEFFGMYQVLLAGILLCLFGFLIMTVSLVYGKPSTGQAGASQLDVQKTAQNYSQPTVVVAGSSPPGGYAPSFQGSYTNQSGQNTR